ncbi:MAG TPA: HEPN domain-containing protein [Puia sp.]|jgi:hypothetical protein|nr:HEPN domain-containing protein [Puia sp.]
MTDYSGRFVALKEHIDALEKKFIEHHLAVAGIAAPDSYDLDIRAFCVLSHAAFEQFVEDICVGLAQDAISAWLYNHCCSQPLLALMAFQCDCLTIDSDPKISFSMHIRLASDKARTTFSNYLQTQNHGVSAKYLRYMLLSVGLDMPDNSIWLGSLEQLAKERGNLAHKSHVKKIPSPKDAQDWVQDCVKMLKKICDDALIAMHHPKFAEDDFRNYVI